MYRGRRVAEFRVNERRRRYAGAASLRFTFHTALVGADGDLPVRQLADEVRIRTFRGEVLVITQRAAGMVFAGGALVFPGGRIDPEDRVRAAQHSDLPEDDAAARIAAIRETVEEVGFDFGLGVLCEKVVQATVLSAWFFTWSCVTVTGMVVITVAWLFLTFARLP